MMPPKAQLCSSRHCNTKVTTDNSTSVGDIGDKVREHIVKSLERTNGTSVRLGLDARVCFSCVRKCAYPWGFPRNPHSVDPRRSLCAADNFNCSGNAVETIPTTIEGMTVDRDRVAEFLNIPPYAPDRCLCSNHRMKARNWVSESMRDIPLQPPTKRARSSDASCKVIHARVRFA